MNILLVNHYAGSPELGMEFRPYYMAKEWVKAGHNVLIVGASFSHLRKKQPEREESVIDGVRYRWIKVNPYQGNGLGRTRSMFTFVSKLYIGYKKFLGDFRPDAVIASSTYPLDIYPCRRIAKHYGAKLVYEVHDLWPLSPMELGGYSKHHPFIMVMQAAEDYCYRHADKVVSLLPAALPHMVERGMEPNKFTYVPNGFDPAEWNFNKALPDEHQTTITHLHDEGKFVLLYVGGHAISNSLDTLLDAAKLIENKKVAIVLVGKGNEKSRMMKRVDDEKIENVFFLPPVDKQCVPTLLSEADALYIGWEANPLYRFGICPNKLVDYMVSGKPIIHSVTAANDAVNEAGCGISVPAGDAEGVARAIDSLSEYPASRLDSMGKLGKEYALCHWDYGKLSDDFISTPPHYLIINELYPDHAQVFKTLRSEGSFVVGFAGAHGIANSLYTLLDAARTFHDEDKVQFVLIGGGQEKKNLMQYASSHKIGNVHFLDPVEKSAIPMILPLCDVLYIGLQRQPLFRFGISPNKMFDYMMAARPIIQAIEAGNNLVEEAGCGLAVEPENVAAIGDAVRCLKATDRDKLKEMGDHGQRFALENHAYPVLAKRFLDALN